MTTTMSDLKPNRNLLDPNFDGYKLSLDPLPVYRVALDAGVDEVRLSEDQYSYQHVKAFGAQNHLTSDPWNPDLLYYLDTAWNIRKYTNSQSLSMSVPEVCIQLQDVNDLQRTVDRLSVSLYATSPQYMCVSDGTGHLYILHTGDRMHDAQWKICYKGSPVSNPDSDTPVATKLIHSVYHMKSDTPHIECLLLHVIKNPEADNENKAPAFLTCLTWITLQSAGEDKWELCRTRCLRGASAPDYCVIDEGGQAIIISSEKPFQYIYDSVHPVEQLPTGSGESEKVSDEKNYAWTQTAEDLTIFFSLPPDTTKPDIAYLLTADTVDIGIKNVDILLQGALFAAVDVDSSTWTISQDQEKSKLELQLEKAEPGMWPEVVVGDKRGHLVADMDQIEEIHQRLAHLTSDKWNPTPEGSEKPYNSQELEDCDLYPDSCSSLVRFDGDTHLATHQANLSSHQWLFNIPADGTKLPCLCLRHDVDGLLWQPVTGDDQTTPWQHIGTFNAFGYVQASKQQKKFCSCAPDLSYVVICDCIRHIYIYRQPTAILSPLRNRKTGREVSALAKQQLVSLDSVDHILGLSVQCDKLFVITKQTLFMVRINETRDLEMLT